jgi:MAP7 domain-containing protein 1
VQYSAVQSSAGHVQCSADCQVEERRRDIERSEQGRREAIITRNKERESRLEATRRSSQGRIEFAFGSSAPRLVEPRVDSASGYWGSRRWEASSPIY